MADTSSRAHSGRPRGHEPDYVNVRSLWISAVVLVLVCIASGVVVLYVVRYVDRQIVAREQPLAPLAIPAGEQSRPEPRLLTNEPANLATFRAEEAQKVDTYGWIDQPGGIARIPVERAKDLILERGLPARVQ